MKRIIPCILFIYFFGITFTGFAQTCSCAGNPSFNPMDQSLTAGKHWYFELSYRYHLINDLVRGSEVIENNINRKRSAGFTAKREFTELY